MVLRYLGLWGPDEVATPTQAPLSYCDLPYHDSMEQHSRHIIARALQHSNGSQTRAAERLKLQRTYLARLIRQKNIPPPHS